MGAPHSHTACAGGACSLFTYNFRRYLANVPSLASIAGLMACAIRQRWLRREGTLAGGARGGGWSERSGCSGRTILSLSKCVRLRACRRPGMLRTHRTLADLVIIHTTGMRSRTWSPSGFVNAALRKRLSGDLDGLGRLGSPRGRWIPPFGGRGLHVRTLELLLY